MNTRTRERCVVALLYLVPVCIGVVFWADTSAHGDSAVYRKFLLDLHETGVLQLSSMEWYHPGHYLMLWPVFALGKALGAWTDPLHAISLVNFVATGWAAHAVYRTWSMLCPNDSKLVPFSAAAALATMPAWLWQSQEAMSDVIGTAFVIATTCRLLRHDMQAETQTAAWTLTGFLAAWAGLIRISSGLFLPLWGCLVLRAILRNQNLTWSRVALGLSPHIGQAHAMRLQQGQHGIRETVEIVGDGEVLRGVALPGTDGAAVGLDPLAHGNCPVDGG